MAIKGNLEIDPRGLIYESFRIDGITDAECRTIFLDWALGAPDGEMTTHLQTLLAEYEAGHGGHPMIAVIKEGLEKSQSGGRRRGGRAGRQ